MFEATDGEIVSSIGLAELRARLKARGAATRGEEKYFVLHRASGAVFDSVPFLAEMRSMVGVRIRPDVAARIVLHRGGGSEVVARYWCPKGRERELAQRLAKAREPLLFLRNFYETWFRERTGAVDLSDTLQQDLLRQHLLNDSRRLLGLEAEVSSTGGGAGPGKEGRPPVSPPGFAERREPPAPRPAPEPAETPRDRYGAPGPPPPHGDRARATHLWSHSETFEVRPQGSDLARVLAVTAEIECFAGSFFGGKGISDSALRELLIREVRYFCASYVSFHRLHFELRTSVRQELIQYLGHELQKGGVGSLLNVSLAFADPDPSRFVYLSHEHHEIEVKFPLPREKDAPLLVKHRLELELADCGRRSLSGIGELQPWLVEHLGAATRSVLFNMSYCEIVGEFLRDDHRPLDQIRKRVEERLASAGYKIQHMVLIPDLPPLSWRDRVDLGANAIQFLTLDRRVSFKLEVKASGVVPNPLDDRLRSYLEPGRAKDFTGLIVARLHERLQLQFDHIDPETIYMRFEGLRAELVRIVQETLTSEFAFGSSSVSLLPLENELTQLVAALCEEPIKITVEIPSLADGAQALSVPVEITFDITGVDEKGWLTFKVRNFKKADDARNKITEFFRDSVQASLKTLPGDFVRYSSAQARSRLRRMVEPAVKQVCSVFGLCLNVSNIDRKFAATERPRLEEEVRRLEGEKAFLVSQKEMRLRDLPIPDDPDIKKFEDEIGSLSKKISGLVAEIEAGKKQMQAERSAELPLAEPQGIEGKRADIDLLPEGEP